jgi:uncharacterized protein (TIGR03437 family)
LRRDYAYTHMNQFLNKFAAALCISLLSAASAWGQTVTAVLNAASYTTSIAPGSWVAIYGTGLAPGAMAATAAPFPVSLNGASVTVGGVAAPLQYVSATQINALIPVEAASPDPGVSVSVKLVVSGAAGASPAFNVTLQRNAPALFTTNSAGTGDAVAFDASFNAVTKVGTDPIVLYATGLGPTNPPASSSALGSNKEPLNRLVDKLTVNIGGNTAKVIYAGLAPNLHGIYQINVQPDPYSGRSLQLLMPDGFSRGVTLPIPVGTNVTNVSGSITGLYPPEGKNTVLGISPLLGAALASFEFDIAPGAKPFVVFASMINANLRISIDPIANTWTSTITVPNDQVRQWDFSQAGFAVFDFLANAPLPFSFVPLSRVDPVAQTAMSAFLVGGKPNPGDPNVVVVANGKLPSSRHISMETLGLPPTAFGGFTNVTSRVRNVNNNFTFSLSIDSVIVATKSATYSIP